MKSRQVIIAIASVISVLFSGPILAAPPTANVNVVNTPDVNVANTPDVNVANDTNNPVPVEIVATRPEPFTAAYSTGDIASFFTVFTVPDGMRAEIHYLSARVTTSDPGSGQNLRLVTEFDGGTIAEHQIQMTEGAFDRYVGSEKVLLHAESGSDIRLLPNRCNPCQVRGAITGYLFEE